MDPRELQNLGDADLQIGCLRIWVHGRQFPDSQDYWDGNWLRATAYCASEDSTVRVHGSIIHLREVVGLLRGCEHLYKTLEGGAGLNCIEPNLDVELTAKTGGHIDIKIKITITPDHMGESHEFLDGFDQTYLPGIMLACKTIIDRFPIREAEKLPG